MNTLSAVEINQASPRKIIQYHCNIGRCHSQLAESLPEDEKPECRPYWEEDDPDMPLPFDLEAIIHDLESLQKKMES
uniref:Uncharacterized protein n=1 Tax=Sphaerodactylus townsendi TaxID=933632 RepID=A0ACB8E9W6_9SAUR